MLDVVIGLIIVVIGILVFEFVIMVMVMICNDCDVVVGNFIGSCIYNVLVIFGIICLVVLDGVVIGCDILLIDLLLVVVVVFVCLLVFCSDWLVLCCEGVSFVCVYLVYLGWLVFVCS